MFVGNLVESGRYQVNRYRRKRCGSLFDVRKIVQSADHIVVIGSFALGIPVAGR